MSLIEKMLDIDMRVSTEAARRVAFFPSYGIWKVHVFINQREETRYAKVYFDMFSYVETNTFPITATEPFFLQITQLLTDHDYAPALVYLRKRKLKALIS